MRILALLLASTCQPLARHSPFGRSCRRAVHVVGCGDGTAGDDEPSLEGEWRLERARLDERWSASVRARKTRFLPFTAARQWARAMHFTEEADWRTWIEDGEKRSALACLDLATAALATRFVPRQLALTAHKIRPHEPTAHITLRSQILTCHRIQMRYMQRRAGPDGPTS